MATDSTVVRKVWVKGPDGDIINLDHVMRVRRDPAQPWIFFHNAIARAAGVTGSDNAVQVLKYADATAADAAYAAIIALITQNGFILDISAF